MPKTEYTYATLAKFNLCGQRLHIIITGEDEARDLQTDEHGQTTCLASSPYWALVTLAEAGKITDLEFSNMQMIYEDEDDEE